MSKSNLDQIISLELTAHEIMQTCGLHCHTACFSQESIIANLTPVWKHEVENPRTGYSACIVQVEEFKEKAIATDYMIELKTNTGIVILIWEGLIGCADYELAQRQAHQAFIKVCALIGVRVGYEMVTNPHSNFSFII